MEQERIKEIQRAMQEHIGESGTVSLTTVTKVGGEAEAIRVSFDGDKAAMLTYSRDLERMLESGTSTKDIGVYLAGELEKRRHEISGTFSQGREAFKMGLFIQMVNTEVNRELLKWAVHDEIDDMSAIVRCRVSGDDRGMESFIVTKNNMDLFRMTQGEILERAYKNTAQQEFEMKSIRDTLADMMREAGMSEVEIGMMAPPEDMPIYIYTNEERLNGANVLVCPQALAEAYEKVGEPYYVLPSSTHEVLLVPESAGIEPKTLREMVHDVNVTEVQPEDLLSFKVFKFDGRKLEVARDEVQTVSEVKEKLKKVL